MADKMAEAVAKASTENGRKVVRTFINKTAATPAQAAIYDVAVAALKQAHPKDKLDFEMSSRDTYLAGEIERAILKASQTR